MTARPAVFIGSTVVRPTIICKPRDGGGEDYRGCTFAGLVQWPVVRTTPHVVSTEDKTFDCLMRPSWARR